MFHSRLLSGSVTCFTALFLALLVSSPLFAGEHERTHKNAIVLAMFGTTVEPALEGLLNIKEKVEKRYPNTPIKIAFTSNIIRKIWMKRSKDPAYIKQHPEIPAEILHVQSPIATLATLSDHGYDTIVIQPTHIAHGEEFLDLSNLVKSLSSIHTTKAKFNPFNKIALGRPFLGTIGTAHPYSDDIEAVVHAMKEDIDFAKKQGADTLVYMGHGNDFFPSGGQYLEFEYLMNKTYPDIHTIIGNVEGFPNLQRTMEKLRHSKAKKIVLKPFMVVAGDHAMNDMAGEEEDAWKKQIEKAGIEVIPVIKGLGVQDPVAEIFVQHLADAAKDAEIKLK